MTKKLRIVLAQLNLTVGDLEGNLKKHLQAASKARDELAADVIVFPELSLTGYPPEDLLLRPAFLEDAAIALQKLTEAMQGIYCIVSHPQLTPQGLNNTASVIFDGKILGSYAKQHLPNYGVFDEDRYFVPGNITCVVPIKGIPTGIVVCEDLWFSAPTEQAVAQGARLILSPNASPFEVDKHAQRVAVLSERAKSNHTPIVYVNSICGQDELVFDGGSMVANAKGEIAQFAGFFNEILLPVDIEFSNNETRVETKSFSLPSTEEKIYECLVLAIRDYINKNGAPGVLVGVSGGIDSALTLTLAVDALGKDRVRAVLMPSRFTADISNEDALLLANHLGVRSETLSIEASYKSFLSTLAPCFVDPKTDVTEENIQARCRAILLMALSNKTGYLVLSTSNRSETAVGYTTLYGDMAGGFAPLKDVPKTMVYKLANYRNQRQAVIPQRTIERPPTAELAPNQKDEDSLPPYALLDKILEHYLNECLNIQQIIDKGFDAATVNKVARLIHKSEYKRRQGPISPRINHKSFGKDWRYPVTNKFKN